MTLPFPVCVTAELHARFSEIEGVQFVAQRALRETDPDSSIGIVALDWVPGEHELGQLEPTLSTYVYAVQSFSKSADEAEGLLRHALLAKIVRTKLYRSPAVRLALAALTETSLGVTERTQRWGVRQQRFASNENQGQFLYLSTTEIWLQTETV